MKKYIVSFSLLNMFNDSTSETVRLQQIAKGLTGMIAGCTWAASDSNHAIYVGVGGYILDQLIGCLSFEKKQ